jgi:enoyl-CoA hydratase/carnithine racemase
MPGVTADRDRAVGIARLDDPESNNTLTPSVMEDLADMLEGFDGDDDVRCILVAGAPEVFALGGDLVDLENLAAVWRRLAAISTPMVAAVSGYAIGGGFELALVCDLVVASETAEFGQPEIMVGLIPGGGATQRLARSIGKHRAMELVLTGRRIDAKEAHRMGLVNQVAPKKEWMDRALELANLVAGRAPIAARLAKRAVLAAEDTGLDAGLAEERRLHMAAMATEDRVEGIRALSEHRAPEFRGR